HLLPIIAPQKQPDPTEADRLINRLITTINAVEQPQVWEIEVADYEWWPKGDPDSPDTDYELEPVPPAERQEGPRFVSSARRISLLGYDWFVGNFFWGNLTIEDIRRDLYLIVAEALKNGDLSRLRHCPCRKFFIAHDLRQNFCSVD